MSAGVKRLRALACALAVLGFLPGPPATARDKAPATVAGLPAPRALVLGERMYREGLLPSGEPMACVVSGDVPVAGTAFTCVSCHLRGGLGSWEGGIVTLATNGARLAQPRYWKFPNLSPAERVELKLQNPPARPAYTDKALAHVIRTGIDPDGRELHPIMPRYDLNDRDMALLIHYLRNLSAHLSPGTQGDTIRFATVVTEGISAEDERAMVVPISNYVARHNQFSAGFGNRMYLGVGGNEMSGAYRRLSLSVWHLKGEPSTWGRQLQAHLDREPVFALLGGLAAGEWKPIHDFCERQHLPCLFPLTDLPVVSDTDWYTQYFSKGYYQEGQAAARYLRSLEAPDQRILQLIQDGPEGRDLAAGFRETWLELGQGAPIADLRLAKGETVSPERLRDLLGREHPTAVLLWTGVDSSGALAGIADLPGRPGQVFLSGRLLGSRLTSLPATSWPFVRITYPYRDPREEPEVSKYAETLLAGMVERYPEARVSTRAYALVQILRQALMDLDRNLYRDNLLDRIGMQRDQILPDYLRLSFGPGQRYASKGCFIMQLEPGPGPGPNLVRKSEWVIH